MALASPAPSKPKDKPTPQGGQPDNGSGQPPRTR